MCFGRDDLGSIRFGFRFFSVRNIRNQLEMLCLCRENSGVPILRNCCGTKVMIHFIQKPLRDFGPSPLPVAAHDCGQEPSEVHFEYAIANPKKWNQS